MGLFDMKEKFKDTEINGVSLNMLTLSDKKKFTSILNKCEYKNISWECSFAFLYVHSLLNETFWIEKNECIVVFSKGKRKRKYDIIAVIAESDEKFEANARDIMTDVIKVTGHNFTTNQMLKRYAEILEPIINEIYVKDGTNDSVKIVLDYGDFIFDNKVLSEIKGKDFRARRNLVNGFKKEYPNHVIREYKDDDWKEIEGVRDYFIKNRMSEESFVWDVDYYKYFFNFRKELDIDIYVMEIDGKVEGYIMFSPLCKDTMTTIIENCNMEYKGITEYLWYEGVKRMLDRFKYSNDGNGGAVGGGLYSYKSSHKPINFNDKNYLDFKRGK